MTVGVTCRRRLFCVWPGPETRKGSTFQGVWIFGLTEWQRAAGRHEGGETSTTAGEVRCACISLKEAVDAMQQALEIAREHGSERRFCDRYTENRWVLDV